MQGTKKKRAVISQKECVACGCCMKVCPFDAISVLKGICAKVDAKKCVGCGKCAKECPASVIHVKEVMTNGDEDEEKKEVV